jgi:HEAT repeat protein
MRMRYVDRWSVPSLAAGFLAAVSGCADGPVPEMRYLNPWIREQWAKDEQYAPTYHRKMTDLAKLRSQAANLPPEEREKIASGLAARLKDEPSPALRAELVRTLGELPTPAAQQAILAAMADETAYVRTVACTSLGRYPNAEGFQSLSQAVASDADLDVRVAAARELGKFRDFEAPQALRPALDDRDPALQVAAMQSLENLTGQTNFRNSVSTWREYLDGGNPTPPPGPSVAEVVKQYWSWF